jgi:hypothetical protein
MFALTSKVKIAAGIAAGVLTLGAAGAYAANANSTITVANPTPIALPNNGPTLMSVDNKTLTLPSSFANKGECISFFAKNRDFALAPSGTLPSTLKLSKNYHGKLISGLQSWCASQTSSTAKTSAETETPDAAQSAEPETDSTDSADLSSGGSHGHGHGHGGHGRHASLD